MFFGGHTVPVRLREVYHTSRSVEEHAVNAQVLSGTLHTMHLTVSGQVCEMVLDEQTAQAGVFPLASPASGYVSLVSNASVDDHGAFRRLRVAAGGETLVDIDFTTIKDVTELEAYFEGYYFPCLEWGQQAMEVPISRFWELNERGHLRCKRVNPGRIPTNDCGAMCLLTLRMPPVEDFVAEVEFEQCWKRYGLLFGCEKGAFAYGAAPHTGKIVAFQGGFAFAGARGTRNMMGDLMYDERLVEVVRMRRHGDQVIGCSYEEIVPTFGGKEQRSLRMHTLTFHYHTQMRYVLEDRVLQAEDNAVVYLPPYLPCKLEGDDKDAVFRIEFECLEDLPFEPLLIQPKNGEGIRRLCKELQSVWRRTGTDRDYRSLALFYQLLAELERERSAFSDNASLAIRTAMQYMDAYFALPKLSVKAVAQATDVSESYLFQLFREAGHPSPKEYIVRRRIEYACKLLQAGEHKVCDVAARCGFADAKYFTTAFRRVMGETPKQYGLRYKK